MDVSFIRKAASLEVGRRYLEEQGQKIDPASFILMQKGAAAEDQELLQIASHLDGDTLANYEALGGTYKTAFGQPMFQAPAAPTVGGTPGVGMGTGAPALKPVGALKPPAAPGAPGMGGGGTTNPVKPATTPQIPGTSGNQSGT